jgi:multiple sugar transport system permease protein
MTTATARTAVSSKPKAARRMKKSKAPYAMIAPFAALFLIFFLFPLLYSIGVSFTSARGTGFVGLANYQYMFGLSAFWSGILRVIYFGIIQVTVMIGCSVVLALFLDSPYAKARKVFSTIYFLPYAVPGVIAAIMWGFLFTPQLDGLLRLPVELGLSSKPFDPLDPTNVLYAIMFIVTWEFTGYNMTIYMTSLSSIPREILDAARIDGASEGQIARRIKLPLLRRTLTFTLVLSIIGTLQLFNEPSIIGELTPIGTSYTPNLLIYTTAFSFSNIPAAAAMSVVLAIITIAGSLAFFRLVRPRDERRPRKAKK